MQLAVLSSMPGRFLEPTLAKRDWHAVITGAIKSSSAPILSINSHLLTFTTFARNIKTFASANQNGAQDTAARLDFWA
jgi:hypothetical protein